MPSASTSESPLKRAGRDRRTSASRKRPQRTTSSRPRTVNKKNATAPAPHSIHDVVPVSPVIDGSLQGWRERFETLVRAQVLALLEYHEIDTGTIEVLVDGGRVILVGHVRDGLTRELVEDLAWWVPTVRHCDNHLRVAA